MCPSTIVFRCPVQNRHVKVRGTPRGADSFFAVLRTELSKGRVPGGGVAVRDIGHRRNQPAWDDFLAEPVWEQPFAIQAAELAGAEHAGTVLLEVCEGHHVLEVQVDGAGLFQVSVAVWLQVNAASAGWIWLVRQGRYCAM